MILLLAALALILASGVGSLLLGRGSNRIASIIGVGGGTFGSVLGLVPTLRTLLFGERSAIGPIPWNVPWGSFALELDQLSALFLLPIFVLTPLAAIHGASATADLQGKKRLSAHWFFYNLLTVSMATVFLSRNGMLFLMAWEVMSLASFFLVTLDDESESVRSAGRIYLITSHLGAALIFVGFILLARGSGTMDFEAMADPAHLPDLWTGSLIFLLAVFGFGSKAGFMPMHIWLPEAHQAARSHVAAVESGVMVQTGIYGIIRILTLLPNPPYWWGWVLVTFGALSAVFGILFSLAQHDVRRLLAYSSVENVGIIALGLGTGLIGMSSENDGVALLGFTGALWHVVNHAMFKGLLFLGASSIRHATGTSDVNQLGGLIKRMPLVGLSMIVAAAAICGLPPLNGFPGEFLIYLGAYKGEIVLGPESAAMTLAVIGSLALAGGFAAVAFTKLIGMSLLGSPRTRAAAEATKPGLLMSLPMLILAGVCLVLGLGAGYAIKPVAEIASSLSEIDPVAAFVGFDDAIRPMGKLSAAGLSVLGICSALAMLRFLLLKNREVTESGTWGCGFAAPTERMQYTGSSYVQPVLAFFGVFVRPVSDVRGAKGLFPEPGGVTTETPDLAERRLFRPLFAWIERMSGRLRWIQQGTVHSYSLYISVTLFVLLVWYLGWAGTS